MENFIKQAGHRMRILITGNLGYVGSTLVQHLRSVAPRAEIIGYDAGFFAHCLTGAETLPETQLTRQHFGDVRELPPELLEGVDAIVAPATPSAAFGVGEKGSADPIEMYLNDVFTVTVNMAGLPGIAVPGGLSADGLPLGLQLVGRPFDEETLFSLAHVVEQAAGRFSPERWW